MAHFYHINNTQDSRTIQISIHNIRCPLDDSGSNLCSNDEGWSGNNIVFKISERLVAHELSHE